jgi:glucose-1-phosphate cytidylyltransferase
MQTIILAGGLGSRLSEESGSKPKPMVEIGGYPILWHIMKTYSSYGFNDFIICLGYKGYVIKEYFNNYFLHTANVKISLKNGFDIKYFDSKAEPWTISLVDTGLEAQTGGRLQRVSHLIKGDTFLFTYGDGLSDINVCDLLKFHKKMNKEITVTAVKPPGRFGSLKIRNSVVTNFIEKPDGDGSFINGGFFVANKNFLSRITDSQTILENEPLQSAANEGQLSAFVHRGFWRPMDTLRDKNHLEEMWTNGKAPWRVWR